MLPVTDTEKIIQQKVDGEKVTSKGHLLLQYLGAIPDQNQNPHVRTPKCFKKRVS